MTRRRTLYTGLWALITALLFAAGCDNHCISRVDEGLWEPSTAQYRLELTNTTPFMVELLVDGKSLGVFCDGVRGLSVGNFDRSLCSVIEARFLDNPSHIFLDDCQGGLCEANNLDGRTCYDTSQVERVEARLD